MSNVGRAQRKIVPLDLRHREISVAQGLPPARSIDFPQSTRIRGFWSVTGKKALAGAGSVRFRNGSLLSHNAPGLLFLASFRSAAKLRSCRSSQWSPCSASVRLSQGI